MRRILILALAATSLLTAAACGSPAEPPAAPTAAPATAAPATTAAAGVTGPTGIVLSTATACEAADGAYAALGPSAQAQVAKGVRAEAAGDTATVRKALRALEPIFTSTSATFADIAGKVEDPALREGLTSLSEAAAKAATFETFTEFQSMAALTAVGEATLKQKCAQAGYLLKNIE